MLIAELKLSHNIQIDKHTTAEVQLYSKLISLQ